MEVVQAFLDFFIHLDKYLSAIIQSYGVWTYLILFLIIFSETGFVITPFLPGDSLLFAAGAFAAIGSLEVELLIAILSSAAILGNLVNYWIGYHIGPKIFHKENVRFLNRQYLDRTHRFYEKHGGKTIVIARFIPIIRTFAPFVAGLGFMNHWRFSVYNITAGIAWVCIFVLGGFFFGNMPAVKKNFTLVILAIIIISVMPAVIEFLRHKIKKQ